MKILKKHLTFNVKLLTFTAHKNTNTMNKRMTSYEYKQKKIAKLEMDLKILSVQYEKEFLKRNELEKQLKELEFKYVSLEGENNRLYQQACETEKELKEAYKTIDKLEGNYKEDPKPGPVIKPCETCKEFKDGYCWLTIPCINYQMFKPKPEPVYIPFTFADADKLVGKAVRDKLSNDIDLITGADNDCVIAGSMLGYARFMDSKTFLDGSICGKLAE